ncbi:uncharacterized protein KZ484_007002 isoform 1-T2 [Pholidichthys leucotaenia]
MSVEIQSKSGLRVTYSRGVREEENEIEDSEAEMTEDGQQYVNSGAQTAEEETQEKLPSVTRRNFRGFKVALGLFGVLVVSGCVIRYIAVHLENIQLWATLLDAKNMGCSMENNTAEADNKTHPLGKENQTQGDTAGWKTFWCDYYYISTERKNWSESREDCRKRGADLVILNTRDKCDFFRKQNETGDFWIGLESVQLPEGENEWKWVDGSKPSCTSRKTGMNTTREADMKAFMDEQGQWWYTNNGTKNWICEKNSPCTFS